MEWLHRFKIAVIENDIEAMNELLDNMPKFETVDEAVEAQHLIGEAISHLKTKRQEVAKEMAEIVKAKKFLTSSRGAPHDTTRLDITS
jgi:hypothetical protein